MATSIKLYCLDSTVRRLSADQISAADLISLGGGTHLVYSDDEGDKIHVHTDADLAEAVRQASGAL